MNHGTYEEMEAMYTFSSIMMFADPEVMLVV